MRLPDPERSRVVLIGVGEYEHLEALPAAVRNVERLSEVFQDRGVWGIEARFISSVSGNAPTREALAAVRRAAADAEDTLLVYYSGHGLVDSHDHELYLALRDSEPAAMETALRYEYLRRAVSDSRALRKVVILDCCHSGAAMLGGMGVIDDIANQALIQGAYLLTACAATRRALAPLGAEFSSFTGELLDVLNGGLLGEADHLTMDVIYHHLSRRLLAKSRPVPQQRNGENGARIVLAKNRAFSGEAESDFYVKIPRRFVPTSPPPGHSPNLIARLAQFETNRFATLLGNLEFSGQVTDEGQNTTWLRLLASVAEQTIDAVIPRAISPLHGRQVIHLSRTLGLRSLSAYREAAARGVRMRLLLGCDTDLFRRPNDLRRLTERMTGLGIAFRLVERNWLERDAVDPFNTMVVFDGVIGYETVRAGAVTTGTGSETIQTNVITDVRQLRRRLEALESLWRHARDIGGPRLPPDPRAAGRP